MGDILWFVYMLYVVHTYTIPIWGNYIVAFLPNPIGKLCNKLCVSFIQTKIWCVQATEPLKLEWLVGMSLSVLNSIEICLLHLFCWSRSDSFRFPSDLQKFYTLCCEFHMLFECVWHSWTNTNCMTVCLLYFVCSVPVLRWVLFLYLYIHRTHMWVHAFVMRIGWQNDIETYQKHGTVFK